MKKSDNRNSKPRKLLLRRNTIALLTVPQFSNVFGGGEEESSPVACTAVSPRCEEVI